jgi:hypothetical protein
LIIAFVKYDVFVFAFWQLFLKGNLDLSLLRFLRKRIICHVASGSELRPSYSDGSFQKKDGAQWPLDRNG